MADAGASPSAPPQPAPIPTPTAKTSTAPSSSSSSKPAPTGEWSAALKFAPRAKKPAAPASASRAPAWKSSSSASTSVNSTYTAAQVIMKPPELTGASGTSTPAAEEVILGTDGKPLAKAPSMTLRTNTGYRKGAKYARGGAARPETLGDSEGKKRKKKKVRPRVEGR